MTSAKLYLDVWSDFVCPFCYLEVPVIEQFQNAFGDAVEVRWHAFELRAEPTALLDPDSDLLHETWENSVYPMAHERGLLLRLPGVTPRSRKAFETAFFARESGRFDVVHRAIFKAYFAAARDIGGTDALLDIAATCGIDPQVPLLDDCPKVPALALSRDEEFATKLGVTG